MTPADIETACRERINAVNDTLWSSSEIMTYLYFAMVEFIMEVRCTDAIHTDTSVQNQSTYALPPGASEINRITYNGVKLEEIDLRTYDSLIGGIGTAATGTPMYYWVFNDTLNLYPIPDTAGLTIQYWTFDEPSVPTSTSTLSIPSIYHWALVEGTLYHMTTKEIGDPRAPLFEGKWERGKQKCLSHNKRKRRSDTFTRVKREEDMVMTNIGAV